MDDHTKRKPVVLTCAQPTGTFHLGNYLGAFQHWVSMLEKNTCFFGIVDLHSITLPQVPARLKKATLDCLAQYIACGLDPEKCTLFVQSHIVGHAELAWILSCLTPIGLLERMTQFKDKARRAGLDSVGAGLLNYPVLQAADILLYNADLVPVGRDQKQHLELTRDLAQKFNATYAEVFKIPEPFIAKEGVARVMSLQDPTRKMSKSDVSQNGVLYLLDSPEKIRKKVQSAVTDSGIDIVCCPEKPGITNLLHILSAVTGKEISECERAFQNRGYGVFKKEVADAIIALLEPIRKRYEELIKNKEYLLQVLKAGNETAQNRAYEMLCKVYRKVGLLERPR